MLEAAAKLNSTNLILFTCTDPVWGPLELHGMPKAKFFPQTKHSQSQNISQSLFTRPYMTKKEKKRKTNKHTDNGGNGLDPTQRYEDGKT